MDYIKIKALKNLYAGQNPGYFFNTHQAELEQGIQIAEKDFIDVCSHYLKQKEENNQNI